MKKTTATTKTTRLRVLHDRPNPTRCERIVDPDLVDSLRRLDCQHYDDCLEVAADRDWPGFHCNGCGGYTPQTPAQRFRDHRATLEMLADTQLLAGLAAFSAADDPGTDADGDDDPPFTTDCRLRNRSFAPEADDDAMTYAIRANAKAA
jgi:hypothetical protein